MIINSQKSTLSLIGIDEATSALYKTLFPFPIQDLHQGIKYLGFNSKQTIISKGTGVGFWKN
jgi:hypothetical protein